MTYLELVREITRLPHSERLSLLGILTRTVQDDLATPAKAESSLPRILGIGSPEGSPPTDEAIRDEYAAYLLAKYS